MQPHHTCLPLPSSAAYSDSSLLPASSPAFTIFDSPFMAILLRSDSLLFICTNGRLSIHVPSSSLSKEAQGNSNAARSEPWPDLKFGAWPVALCAGDDCRSIKSGTLKCNTVGCSKINPRKMITAYYGPPS